MSFSSDFLQDEQRVNNREFEGIDTEYLTSLYYSLKTRSKYKVKRWNQIGRIMKSAGALAASEWKSSS